MHSPTPLLPTQKNRVNPSNRTLPSCATPSSCVQISHFFSRRGGGSATLLRLLARKIPTVLFWHHCTTPNSRLALLCIAREYGYHPVRIEKRPKRVIFQFWRRGGDSNSRYGNAVHRFSRAAPSTTQTPLLALLVAPSSFHSTPLCHRQMLVISAWAILVTS